MPELPEVQAHAERLTEAFAGRVLRRFTPLTFTALKTAVPQPSDAYGLALQRVGRRGKYLLLEFEPVTFVVHLMQGGRLLVDTKQSAKPRGGQARFNFEPPEDGSPDAALLLTEQGTERRAGVWCVPTATALTDLPLSKLGPDALDLDTAAMQQRMREFPMRLHGFLRDQHMIAGLGRMLANEVCHRAKLSPFANTGKLGADDVAAVVTAIHACVTDGLAYERTRTDMSSSKDRPGNVHGRIGEPCNVCGDTIRSVAYSSYTVAYCPTCQTNGKVLADNTTSKFLR
ncbi:MAG TPA: DNA-formamidopyrimidine glycosylase family protein [Ilumatobacteraceae bacterium]|nr:DNA-formamidopyrimidine glycosylase family protein [Ilumatobacteraceae bacterium]